ncbi:MAG: mechanosensitive ion channel [Thermoplasmata archaeon]
MELVSFSDFSQYNVLLNQKYYRYGKSFSGYRQFLLLFSLLSFSATVLVPLFPSASAQGGGSEFTIEMISEAESYIGYGDSTEYFFKLNNNALSNNFTVLIDIFNPHNDTGWIARGYILETQRSMLKFTLEPTENITLVLNITSPDSINKSIPDEDIVSISFTIIKNVPNGSASDIETRTFYTKTIRELGGSLSFWEGVRVVVEELLSIWILFCIALNYIIFPILLWIASKTSVTLDDDIIKVIRSPTILAIIFFGIRQFLLDLSFPHEVKSWISILYIISLIILGTVVVWNVFEEIIMKRAKRYSKLTHNKTDDVVVPLLEKIGKAVIVVISVIVIFSYMGFDITVFIAGAGIIGIVIGLAAQDTLSNFFSGIYILMDRPFVIGDLIQIESDDIYRVEEIGMRATRLFNIYKNVMIFMPNKKLSEARITNLNLPDSRIVNNVTVGVAYGSDMETVMRILMTAALKHPNVVKSKDTLPVIRFRAFGDSALEFNLWFTVDNVLNQFRTAHEIRLEIDRMFRKYGVNVPFPQRTVWVNIDDKDVKKLAQSISDYLKNSAAPDTNERIAQMKDFQITDNKDKSGSVMKPLDEAADLVDLKNIDKYLENYSLQKQHPPQADNEDITVFAKHATKQIKKFSKFISLKKTVQEAEVKQKTDEEENGESVLNESSRKEKEEGKTTRTDKKDGKEKSDTKDEMSDKADNNSKAMGKEDKKRVW